ncbi:TRAP-type C4-dicarboxylate transport system permease small subunit [Chelatococcus asaccharovorans]|uniref:TRAP transporter small permease protein n=1 Tax=Chelatococcus asaccharovorans TaxID=28210 RepID=A0A2V3UE39_9HYPH|nr:TRAP-type C4-dicarboxylate transport system permease small subunit [Chelatococcus asaccharovorans]
MLIKRLVQRAENFLPGFLLALMTVLVIIDVLCRYILNVSFAGSAELATAFFVWLVFIGSAGAVRKLQHIGIEGFSIFIPQAGKPWLHLFMSTAILVVSLHMTRIGYNLSMNSWDREIDMVGIPYFYVYLAIPISFALMAIHSAAQIIDILRNWQDAECVRLKTYTDPEV